MSIPRITLDVGVALALGLALATVYAFDRGGNQVVEVPPPPADPPPPPPPPAVPPPPADPPPPPPPPAAPSIDPIPRLTMGRTEDGQFGVMTTPDPADPTVSKKKLTFSDLTQPGLLPTGETNTTRVWVDGETPVFFAPEKGAVRVRKPDGAPQDRLSWLWQYQSIEVEQVAELAAGDVSRRMDTIRVSYTFRNKDTRPHQVGLAVVIDTLIGDNDGVLFWVPTRAGVISKPITFGKGGEEVPPYIRALERPDLSNPGVVVNLGGLRPRDGEAPAEVVLSGWPKKGARWDYPRDLSFTPYGKPDTAVGLFYAPKPLPPEEPRTVQFTYGLAMHTRRNKLTLDAGTAPLAGEEFDLVALIQQPERDQAVTLDLPEGMSLREPATKTQPVKVDGDYTKVSWWVKVEPNARGTFKPKVRLESGGKKLDEAPAELTVYSRLELRAHDKLPAGQQTFEVDAYVLDPRAGQTVELKLGGTPGLTLDPKTPASQDVPFPGNQGRYGKVQWSVKADGRASGQAKLTVILQPAGVRQEATIVIQPSTRLELRAHDKLPASQQSFWVAAYVLDPRAEQTVELQVGGAPGLTLDPKTPASQDVPLPGDQERYGKVQWSVKADSRASGQAKLTVILQPTGVRQEATIVIEPRTLTR